MATLRVKLYSEIIDKHHALALQDQVLYVTSYTTSSVGCYGGFGVYPLQFALPLSMIRSHRELLPRTR